MKLIAAKNLGMMPVFDLSVEHDSHSFVHAKTGIRLHNCAFVIADRPIKEFIPLTKVGGVTCTQYTAPSVEAAGGVKMDFLVVNSLGDIRDAISMIQQRFKGSIPDSVVLDGRLVPKHRLVPLPKADPTAPPEQVFADVWSLPEDQNVFREVAEGKTASVFQFNTPGAVQWLAHFNHWKDGERKAIDSIEAMSAFTALDRPGPLDAYVETADGRRHNMLVEYARRARGETPHGSHPVFMELFPETFGVLTYQEQLQRAYRELTGCTGAEAEEFRTGVAKKKMDKVLKAYPSWMERVGAKIGEESAKAIWDTFVTWGQYGFNKSHSVCYVHISYACSYLKHHYPLEWWCAVLRNASKNEVSETFWRHIHTFVDLPDVNSGADNFTIINERIKAPIALINGVGPTAHKQLMEGAPYRDIVDFCERIQSRRIAEKKPTIDKATGKQKQMKKGELCWTLGRSALTRGVIHRLIAAGVMDPLFPQGADVADKVFAFEAAYAASRGEKKVQPVPEVFTTYSPVRNFQMRKGILPIYSEPLLPLLLEGPANWPRTALKQDGARHLFAHNNDYIPVISAQRMARLDNVTPWPEGLRVTVAVPAYVLGREVFRWGPKKAKEALKLQLELEGGHSGEFVKWGDRKTGLLDARYKSKVEGGLILALFTKYTENKPFSLDDFVVFHEPPTLKEDDDDKEDSKDPSPHQPVLPLGASAS